MDPTKRMLVIAALLTYFLMAAIVDLLFDGRHLSRTFIDEFPLQLLRNVFIAVRLLTDTSLRHPIILQRDNGNRSRSGVNNENVGSYKKLKVNSRTFKHILVGGNYTLQEHLPQQRKLNTLNSNYQGWTPQNLEKIVH